jgi:glycosyltransferase involved in cell wall biosynthesis
MIGVTGSGGVAPAPSVRMRICLVYDCLFPYTVGGGERWYRALAERLAAEGHEVTYLTLRQWPRGQRGEAGPGVRVIGVGPRMALYTRGGRRRILPPLVFGAGVLAHLLARGRRYEIVHTSSFPYFSLLAAAAARPLARFGLVVDWFEVWSAEYWREYLGALGRVGRLVQRLCASVPQSAFCLTQMSAKRLRGEGLRSPPVLLRGLYGGHTRAEDRRAAEELVVFAGRLIPEKQAAAVVPAVTLAARRIPALRGIIFGDGPERARVLEAIDRAGPDAPVSAPGFAPEQEVRDALTRAMCVLLPTRREGLGTIVLEAAALGVPSVIVEGPDNGATELVESGRNGYVAASADAQDLADAILAVHDGGQALRRRTADWFDANARELSLDGSLELVLAAYYAHGQTASDDAR